MEKAKMIDTVLERETTTSYEFIPVIFANGADDDMPGIHAFLGNEKTQFDEQIIYPHTDLTISRRTLYISNKTLRDAILEMPFPAIIMTKTGVTRTLTLKHCKVV